MAEREEFEKAIKYLIEVCKKKESEIKRGIIDPKNAEEILKKLGQVHSIIVNLRRKFRRKIYNYGFFWVPKLTKSQKETNIQLNSWIHYLNEKEYEVSQLIKIFYELKSKIPETIQKPLNKLKELVNEAENINRSAGKALINPELIAEAYRELEKGEKVDPKKINEMISLLENEIKKSKITLPSPKPEETITNELKEKIRIAEQLKMDPTQLQSFKILVEKGTLEQKRHAIKDLEGWINTQKEKKEKKVEERLTKDQRGAIEIVHTDFIRKMKAINDIMYSIRNISTVSDQTPEEKKLLDSAVKFQTIYNSDLKPALQTFGSFLNTIGEVGIAGYNRMGIIRELMPLFNDIDEAFGNVKNARDKKHEELHAMSIKIEKKEEVETDKAESLKKILERFEKILKLREDFLICKKAYEKDIYPQIIRWNGILTGKNQIKK